MKERIEVGGATASPWGRGKEPCSTEPGRAWSKDLEAGVMDFGMTESNITGIEESKSGSDTWLELESEDGTFEEALISSENMGSCGRAILGQIWWREIEVCGE